jgi:hypothetical protein
MSVIAKWNSRQIGLELLSYVLCFTTALVIVPVAVQCAKFLEFGMDIYPGAKWPKNLTVQYVVDTFWLNSVKPTLLWLPATLVGDALLRRFVYRIRE